MAYQYKLDYGGHSVTLDSDEELTDEEIQEAAEQSFEGVSDTPDAPKEPGVVDMIAPSLNRPLTDKEKSGLENPTSQYARYPLVTGPGGNAFPGGNDPRLFEGAMDVVNTGARAVGAAIPSSLTRGENPDGTTKSFKQAMADTQTGLTRPIREKYEERLGTNLATFKSESNPFKKVLAGIGVGLDGIGLLAASAIEPGAGSIAKAFTRASKAVLTGGRSTAKAMANTYIKEVGVPESALQRLADDPDAIKAASATDTEHWRTLVEEKVQGIKAPLLDQLDKDQRKVMEKFQDRLSDIMEKKVGATVEAQSELDSKIFQLDQEVRDFMDNIKTSKAGALNNLSAEQAAQKGNIEAGAVTAKNETVAAAPTNILGETPKADPLQSGDKVQSALQNAEEGLSARYGELKDEGFGFNEARDAVLPGSRNTVRDAWTRVKNSAQARYGENGASADDIAAFEKLVDKHAPGTGPSTLGGLVNARRHIGKVIYGKTGIKESDDLFRGVNRNLKEDFYSALNDEIGTELHGFYKRKGVPPDVADQIVAAWDDFNKQYSRIRRGLETVEKGIRFSSQGGRTERYTSALGKMGINDLKKAKTATLSAEATRPVWDSLKDAYLNDLIDNASPGGVFSPKKFGKDWSDLVSSDNERLVTILGDEKVKEINSYYKKLGDSLDEIDAVATKDVDALVKAISDKALAVNQKTRTASNAVKDYQTTHKAASRSEAAAQKAAAGREARVAKGQAKEVRDASVEALDKRKAEIEAIGKIVISGTETQLHRAMTQTNMTGPMRTKILEKLTERFGADEAQKIQDAYFAKALGAKEGSIPLFTRMPTGRALLMGFISGHPLAAALATSPQVAAKALKYASAPAGRMGQAIERVTSSPKLMNLFKMLNGVKRVESRNRILLRIMQEMRNQGIEIPDEPSAPTPGGDPATPEEGVNEFPDDFEPDPEPAQTEVQ